MVAHCICLFVAAEEVECIANWRDGQFHFLVGKIHHTHAVTDNEEKFRCFMYDYKTNSSATDVMGKPWKTFPGEDESDIVIQSARIAISADATCNGLFSPGDGSRTLKLDRGKQKSFAYFI